MDFNQQLLQLIDHLLDRDSRDLTRALKRRAREQTCAYIEEQMVFVDGHFADRFDLLAFAIRQVCIPDGLWLEFGVYTGATIRWIAERTPQMVYGFDSFEGNPEDWRNEFRQGSFALTELPQVPDNVQIVKGWFAETLPAFLDTHPGPVALLHIDCDLYSSTKTVLDALQERIVAGTVIVFDEYFNYPGWRNHEFKAFMDFVAQKQCSFEYLGYVSKHSQVAVKMMG